MSERRSGEAAAAFMGRRLDRDGPPLLLDGATGTELERRGVHTGLPLWSTHALLAAPEVVRQIHTEHARAGAEIITANTFRTQRRALARGGPAGDLGDRDLELTRLAVDLARQGAERAGSAALVAGSAPPLEDCYRPDRVPDDARLREEHGRHAGNLAAAGVDLILVETMNCGREAVAAARAAVEVGRPVMVSFVCWQAARLLSGEPLAEAIEAVRPFLPLAVLVNCLPPSAVHACLPALAGAAIAFGVYANLGEPDDATGFTRREDCSPADFARQALTWALAGARLLGGCCGTTPDHIAAIHAAIRSTPATTAGDAATRTRRSH